MNLWVIRQVERVQVHVSGWLDTYIPEQPVFLGGRPLLSGVIHVMLLWEEQTQ
jgi:hypothetical protein